MDTLASNLLRRRFSRPPAGGLVVLLPFVLVAGIGLAFAWPWLPTAPPGGPLLAKYAPVGNGDTWLLARYDGSGQPAGWQSQNAVAVPGLRALTSALSKGTTDALTRFYGDSETIRRLSAVQVTDIRERRVAPDGKLTTTSTVILREPRGDFLLSWRDEGSGTEIVYDPPILAMPVDPLGVGSWEASGKAGPSLEYTFGGRLVGMAMVETPLGRLEDCLEVETRYALARGGQQVVESRARTAYCAGVGAADSTEFDASGAITARTVVVAASRLAGPPAALLAPNPIGETEEPALGDPDGWELTRVGRARFLGDSADATVPAVWVPGDPPLVLAAGYDGDLVAFDISEARGTVAWTFHPDGSVYGPPTVDPRRGRLYFGASDKRLYALDTRGLYLWSFQTGDNIASRPLVVDSTVIFGSEDRTVYGVDADSGELRWKRSTGGSVVSWPARAGDVVVIGSDDGAVYAFDPATGDQRWTYAAGGPVEAPIVAVDGGIYVASRAGTLALLDSDSGNTIWTANVGRPLRDAPGVGDEAVFVVDEPGYLTAVRRSDGMRLWSTAQQTFSYRGGPIPVGNGVVATADDGRIYRLGPDGQELTSWSIATASSPTDGQSFFKLGPSVGGGALWLVDSNAVVRRLGPRGQLGPAPISLAWADNPIGQPPFQTSFLSTTPVEYRGQAVAVDDAGTVFLIDPTNGAATAAGTVGGQGAVVVDPVVVGDTLLVQRGDTLYALGLPDGRPLWQFKGQGSTVHPPAVAGETVLWLSEPEADSSGQATGLLHALDLASGAPRWEAPLRDLNVIGGAVVRDDTVYVSTPPAAFDLATGRPRWQAAVGGLGVGAPALSESGDTLYVGLVNPDGNGGALVALDTADGRERWRADLGSAILSPLERVWVAGQTVVVPLLAPQLVGLDAATGQERWRFEPPVPRIGAVTVEGGRVWLALRNANFFALDAANGRTVARFRDLELNLASVRGLTQRPAVVGNRVLVPLSLLLLGFDRPAEAR